MVIRSLPYTQFFLFFIAILITLLYIYIKYIYYNAKYINNGGAKLNKKVLVLLSLFLVVASMAAVSAFNVSDLFLSGSATKNATVEGVNFNLPDGFSEVDASSSKNEVLNNSYLDLNMSTQVFMNDKGDNIEISVSDSSLIKADDSIAETISMGGIKTQINGVDGYNFDVAGYSGFTYAKDGKLVVVSASDKELLNDVIIA